MERMTGIEPVAVARWLEDAEYPATRALHVEQPIDVECHAVTAWQFVSEREEYPPIDHLAGFGVPVLEHCEATMQDHC
jgi:hypothetical protein